MSYSIRKVALYLCKCERCAHEWRAAELPDRCASCKARHWDAKPGTLKRGRPPVAAA